MNKKVNSILENKKVKITAARELVLNAFLKNDFALSLKDIENILPWSDKVTIFRTLKTFEKKGVLHQINDGSVAIKYALCIDECEASEHFDIHPHFHCNKCGKTICLDKQKIIIENIPTDIVVNNYSLILNGLCSNCK
jgi:Fur family ferric uptake transcriptional regulator